MIVQLVVKRCIVFLFCLRFIFNICKFLMQKTLTSITVKLLKMQIIAHFL